MANYNIVELWISIADAFNAPFQVNKDSRGSNIGVQLIANAYISSNYYGTLLVYVDWANSRIGVYCKSISNGWTYSDLKVSLIRFKNK